MLLHTPEYLVFLFIVWFFYWFVARLIRWDEYRVVFLLVVSYVFYLMFDWRFAVLLLLLSVCVFFLSKYIKFGHNRKFFLVVGVVLNLFVLGVFKYFDFFLESFAILTRFAFGDGSSIGLRLLLPVGISFYSFQAISYLVDVYQGRIKTEYEFLKFCLYMAFFPKLIAGPIVRPEKFLPQLEELSTKRYQFDSVKTGGMLILVGLFKKLLIADGIASMSSVAFSAAAYPTEGLFSSALYWQGFYLYAAQIYADFSGYTDLARGSAVLMGIDIPENFERPYFSTALTDFWNRWHMSLTQWFRIYFFFPLVRKLLIFTGRRYQQIIQVSCTILTMMLIGLWHGAAWSFIVWGAWHGVLLSLEKILSLKPQKIWQKLLSGFVTFHLVGVGWVIFRSGSLANSMCFLTGMFRFEQMQMITLFAAPVFIALVLVFGLDFGLHSKIIVRARCMRHVKPILVIAGISTVFFLLLMNFAKGTDVIPFIYAQF